MPEKPKDPTVALDANDRCKLREITAWMRKDQPQTKKNEALLFSLQASNATSFEEGVQYFHSTLRDNGDIKRSRCVKR